MAKLLDDHLTYVSFPITKYEEDADGNLVVEGRVTDGSVDSDRQVVDPTWSAKALTDWMDSGPNLRVMHSPALYPAGRGLQVDLGSTAHNLRALVVEDTAKKLVRNKVLRAYSVGIANPIIKGDPTGKAPGGIVCGGTLAEVSLVDRPANKNCQLVLAKAADNEVPWTYGDLEGLLAKAEAAGKKPRPDALGADDALDVPETDAQAEDEENPDAEDDDSKDDVAEADLTKSTYDLARDEWLAREPRLAGVSMNSPAFLAKRAEWQHWHAEGETDGLDGTQAGRATWAAKREFDAGVGGGMDRDKIPANDFGDPDNRKYPIVTPKDVSDAAGLAGHAADPDKVRERIVAIAHRKGPEFVAGLPVSWNVSKGTGLADLFDLGKNITTTSPNDTGLVPYNPQGQQRPSADKAAKTCPKCGTDHHTDSKLRRCGNCGAKLPKADKARKDITVAKGSGSLPADVAPAAGHREPDGSAVESLEHDAGMHTDPDEPTDHIPAAAKGKKPFPGAAKPFGQADDDAEDAADGGDDEDTEDETAEKSVAPYRVKRMHDALCAAYAWDTVTGEYPSLKSLSDAIVPGFFAGQVSAAALKGDMPLAAAAAIRAQDADALANGAVEVEKLADARAWLHKAFADLYPDTHLTPGKPPQPGQFQRPYISAGHAPLSAGPGLRAASVPPGTHTPDPDDFHRPLITAGHEASTPSTKGDNLDTGGTVDSGASRTYYRNASRDAARGAMQAMHDHIAGTFPDMCAMAPSRAVMPPDMGDTNRPHPIRPTPAPSVPGEMASKTTEPHLSKKQVAKLVKSAAAQAAQATAAIYKTQIDALQAEIDELGAQPDPAQAPLRGAVVRKAATTEPAVVPSLVEKAQTQAADELRAEIAFTRQFLNHPNLATREAAEARLARLQNA